MLDLEFSYSFEAAHRFSKSESKCSTPHGHSWSASLVLRQDRPKLDTSDMTKDFGALKARWKEFIQSTVDHSFFHHFDDPILDSLREHIPNLRGLALPGDPTTELVALCFFHKSLEMYQDEPLRPAEIRIQETKTNSLRLDYDGYLRMLDQSRDFELFPTAWWTNSDPLSRELGSQLKRAFDHPCQSS